MKRSQLNEVDLVRGVAALAVCCFHLVLGNENLFPSTNFLERFFSYGYLGVESFFILSGYVISYSLPQDFGYSDLRTFFLKRIVRIEPPYLASVVLVLFLNFLSSKLTSTAYQVNGLSILFHLAYLNNFFPNTYVNVVYWTLGIEFQFYILIAFLFPYFLKWKYCFLTFAFVCVGIACLSIPRELSLIIPFLSYFLLGIGLYFFKIKRTLNLSLFLLVTALSLLQIYFYQGLPPAIAAALTLCILLFWTYNTTIIKFFSTISFSLYLIHVPVGGKVINLGIRFAQTELNRYFLVALALGTSIASAYIFCRFIEVPAMHLSKKFSYKKRSNPVSEKSGEATVQVIIKSNDSLEV